MSMTSFWHCDTAAWFQVEFGFQRASQLHWCPARRDSHSRVQKPQSFKGFLPAKSHDCTRSMKEERVSWFFRWLRTGAPGSDSVSTSCEEFANMYCPKVSGQRGILLMVFACFCSSFQTFLKSFSSFIGIHWLYLLLLWGLAGATASRLESVHAGNVVWLLRFRE